MGAQPQLAPAPMMTQVPRWRLASRITFRFCFAYFGLYCLTNQIITGLFPIPGVDIPDPGTLGPVRQLVFWVAARIFHVSSTLVYTDSGSGDKTYDWVLVFCVLIIAGFVTGIWSVLDRKRLSYVAMNKWFRLFIRFALAGQMIVYGFAKAVPLQMPFPYLARLLEPFGNFSPMGVLWSSIGASPAYEIFCGCAEMLGGLLLIVPRTATFGALICLADSIQIFMLNMTYDVPVKLLSFHLILLAIFLLAPDGRRLVNFFFLNRTVQPSQQMPLFGTRRANTIALAAQVFFGLCLVVLNAYGRWQGWHEYGGGSPKSPLYGIWEVKQLTVDEPPRVTLPAGGNQWRRAIFDFPNAVTFQRIDDSLEYYGASINVKDKSLALTKQGDKNWKATFAYQRSAPDQLDLAGDLDSHKIHMQLRLVDRKKFPLISRTFHWIQEYPFNR